MARTFKPSPSEKQAADLIKLVLMSASEPLHADEIFKRYKAQGGRLRPAKITQILRALEGDQWRRCSRTDPRFRLTKPTEQHSLRERLKRSAHA